MMRLALVGNFIKLNIVGIHLYRWLTPKRTHTPHAFGGITLFGEIDELLLKRQEFGLGIPPFSEGFWSLPMSADFRQRSPICGVGR